jgi:HD-GYP domain-containing protein (c-di-GMP phosphodiesterase class II)
MEETHAELHRGESIDVHKRFVRQTLMKLIAGMEATFFEQRLLALTGTAPSTRDPLASHAVNVAVLSIAMGRLLDLKPAQLVNLGFAALFHDIGRALVGRFPNPPGSVEDGEQRAEHVGEGVRLVLGCGLGDAELTRLVVIQEHHRVCDGFPDSPGLPTPHLYSRIIATADAYDKLQNGTPWWPGVNPAEAMRILLRTPKTFETPVAELLRDVIGKTPRGTVLELKNGALVMVMDGGARWGHRPVVRRLFIQPGKPDPDRKLMQINNLAGEIARELDPTKVNVDWRREVRTW